MRFISKLSVVLFLLGTAVTHADDSGLPRDHHPWGRFEVGAWKRVRVFTETFDERGSLEATSTTETTTSLVESDAASYTLYIEVVVEVAGKRFEAQPQVIKQRFDGASSDDTTNIRNLGDDVVEISGRKINSQVREIISSGGKTQRVTTVHYSPQVSPWILQRETTVKDVEADAVTYRTDVTVMAVDMPYRVLAETKTTSHVKTVHQHPKGKTVTVEVQCQDVPGGVVAHSSKETDTEGRSIRRSTLELVDYGFEPLNEEVVGEPTARRRLFDRFRLRKPQ